MNYTIFGESHGPAIGVVLEDVPSGIQLDMELLASELRRRATGSSPLSTPRNEKDQVEILSGVFDGKTTGTPLCMMIRNGDQHSKDYAAIRYLARPGHADFTGFVRYDGFNDYRGGGHFSGRLTAPLPPISPPLAMCRTSLWMPPHRIWSSLCSAPKSLFRFSPIPRARPCRR